MRKMVPTKLASAPHHPRKFTHCNPARGQTTIVWSMTPEAKPDFVPILRELAAGLHEGDRGAHLITVSVDMNKLAAGNAVKAFWIDPRSGDRSPIPAIAKSGAQAFSTPPGWEDSLLVLESLKD
jgi:hypothetical protein